MAASFALRLKPFLLTFVPTAAMLVGLPLLGVWMAGLPVARYLEFPPQTRYVTHARFSWAAFAMIGTLTILALAPLVHRGCTAGRRRPPAARSAARPFPWWGWAGIAFGALAWAAAWTRFSWLASFQAHTFTPLWLAYIVVVNAACHRRTGGSLMTARPLFFLGLFPTSALFWWFFEYLNRFTQNWYYVGASFGAWSYFWFATLPFATVLPAVMSTRELVRSFGWIRRAFGDARPLAVSGRPLLPWALLVAAGAGLAAIGVWPSYLFPLLWVAPLIIIAGLQGLRGRPHPFRDFTSTDWTGAVSAATAALICGFFWEMWNFFSLAQWKYSIPFVHRFQIFEMPLLGYAGYLPFGLECAAVGALLEGSCPTGRRAQDKA
jgi:hypothetical protein